MDELSQALANIVWPTAKQIEYRVYYDSKNGAVLYYTTEDHPGDYLVIDRETFANNRLDYQVRHGRLLPPRPTIAKLVPSDTGVACHPRDITIISQGQNWITNTHEYDD